MLTPAATAAHVGMTEIKPRKTETGNGALMEATARALDKALNGWQLLIFTDWNM